MDKSPSHIVCDDSIIIDGIPLFSNLISTSLHYFSCVARVFTNYRLTFKLSSCNFFESSFEYVVYDLISDGNYPDVSKFNLLQSWPLPPHGISFLSFIDLCYFLNRYCPWFKINIKPLRKLQHLHRRNDIPIMGWTPSTIRLCRDCKTI